MQTGYSFPLLLLLMLPATLLGAADATDDILFLLNENALRHGKTVLSSIGYAGYFEAYKALVQANISEEKRLSKALLPLVHQIEQLEQETKDALHKKVRLHNSAPIFHSPYAMHRLLLATFAHAGARLGASTPHIPSELQHSLAMGDTALTQVLLACGACPNRRSLHTAPLDRVHTIEQAELLLTYGANLEKQQKATYKDFIYLRCQDTFYKDSTAILSLYLHRTPLEAKNQYGHKWFCALASLPASVPKKTICERASILLKHGCYYDADCLMGIIDDKWHMSRDQKTARKAVFQQLFAQDKKHKQSHFSALTQRETTGQHMRQLGADMHQRYSEMLDDDAEHLAGNGQAQRTLPFVARTLAWND